MNTNQAINQVSNQQSNGLNLLDQALPLQLLNSFINPGNGGSKFNKNDLVRFLLVVGYDSFKKIMNTVIDKIIEFIKNYKLEDTFPMLYQLCKNILYNLFYPITSIFTKYKSNIPLDSYYDDDEPIKTNDNSILKCNIDVKLIKPFWEKLLSDQYKHHLQYELINEYTIEQVDNNMSTINEKWNFIKIKTDDWTLIINKQMVVNFDYKNGKKILNTIKIGKNNSQIQYEFNVIDITYDSYFLRENRSDKVMHIDLRNVFPDPNLNACIENLYNNNFKDASRISNIPSINSTYITFADKIPISRLFSVDYQLEMLNKSGEPKNGYTFSDELPIYIIIFNSICRYTINKYRNYIIQKDSILNISNLFVKNYGFKLPYFKNSNLGAKYNFIYGYPSSETLMNKLYPNGNEQTDSKTNLFYKFIGEIVINSLGTYSTPVNLMIIVNYLFELSGYKKIFDLPENTDELNNQVPKMYLQSDSINDITELQLSFMKFINSLNTTLSSNKSSKIKTNVISICRSEKKEKVKNPEYDTYKSSLDNLISKQKETNSTDANCPFKNAISELMKNPVNEFITESTIEKSVKVDLIKETYRSLDSLYLSNKDKDNLQSALYNFKFNREKYERLHICNKLGIMLYGEPGTGKSSSIEAISSYLMRDIYYLSLNSIQTTKELGMVFDYVYNQTNGGGIIVMEDLDCNSKILHKRELGYNIPVQNTMSTADIAGDEQPLTLDYILNILQGTLTRDNSVFIATTNHLDVLDPAFYRDGRFDVKINLKSATHEQIIEMYRNFFEREPNIEIINKISEDKYKMATFESVFSNYLNKPEFKDEDLFRNFI